MKWDIGDTIYIGIGEMISKGDKYFWIEVVEMDKKNNGSSV